MTKMDRAIAKLRALPPERQEELAEYVVELAEEQVPYRLTSVRFGLPLSA